MTALIRYEGDIVATVGRTRAYLSPRIGQLPTGNPLLRFVAMMCSYALDVAEGILGGPYTDDKAELYERSALIEDGEFLALSMLEDAQLALAEHFKVPEEQVPRKRADLAP